MKGTPPRHGFTNGLNFRYLSTKKSGFTNFSWWKWLSPKQNPRSFSKHEGLEDFSQLLLRKLNFTSFMSTEGAETRFFQCSSSSRIWRMGVSFFHLFSPPEKRLKIDLEDLCGFFGDHGFYFCPDRRFPLLGIFQSSVIHSYVSGAEVSLSFRGCYPPKALGVWAKPDRSRSLLVYRDYRYTKGRIFQARWKTTIPWHLLKSAISPQKKTLRPLEQPPVESFKKHVERSAVIRLTVEEKYPPLSIEASECGGMGAGFTGRCVPCDQKNHVLTNCIDSMAFGSSTSRHEKTIKWMGPYIISIHIL